MYEKNFVLPLTNYNCNVILQNSQNEKKTNENESFERIISIIIIIVIQHI